MMNSVEEKYLWINCFILYDMCDGHDENKWRTINYTRSRKGQNDYRCHADSLEHQKGNQCVCAAIVCLGRFVVKDKYNIYTFVLFVYTLKKNQSIIYIVLSLIFCHIYLYKFIYTVWDKVNALALLPEFQRDKKVSFIDVKNWDPYK